MVAPEQPRAQDERTTVRPEDTGSALENPDMGWVFHFYDNIPRNYGSRLAPSDTLDDFPGLTVIYLRIPWSYIEAEKGWFDWSVLDTPAQRWVAKGKQVAFRFSCCESWMRYATPQWVEEAGAKGHDFRPGQGVVEGGPFWEPDYDDLVFLDELDHFLAAAAVRYDGNPEVAFIDVGSFGVWGEGHTFSSTRIPYSAGTVRRHIDLYCKHFKRTLLAANDDFALQGRGQETIDYARERGLTLRDDSILVQGGENAYLSADMAQPFWPIHPVILESEHYGGSRDRGNWQDGSKYLEAVERYHASYASVHWWPREFLAENRDLVARINRRLGYRLQVTEASWPAVTRVGSSLRFAARWRNAGVAPCLTGGCPTWTLKDEQGGIAAVFADEGFDVRALPIGPPGEAEARPENATFAMPFNLQGGTYGVYVSIGGLTGTPRIELPLPEGDGQRRYRLGSLTIVGDYGVQAGALERRGDEWLLPLTWTVHTQLPPGVSPFCHFEREGQIEFQGRPEPGRPAKDLESPGKLQLGCTFAVPPDAGGKSFVIKVGLWLPDRIGKPDERLIPDRGETDRRVAVGRLDVSGEGDVSLAQPQP